MSDTPRTDAEVAEYDRGWGHCPVGIEFAKQLERELRQSSTDYFMETDRLMKERDDLRKTLREVFDFLMPHPNDGRASEFCEHLPKYVKLYAEVEKMLEVKP